MSHKVITTTTNQTDTSTHDNITKSSNVAAQGDNQGYMLSGIENSNINVTDGGAVDEALKMASSSFKNLTDTSQSNYKNMIVANSDALKAALSNSEELIHDSLDSNQKTNQSALDAFKNMTSQAAANTKQLIGMTDKAVSHSQVGVAADDSAISRNYVIIALCAAAGFVAWTVYK